MRNIKLANPYELGVRDATNKVYANPFREFSPKWGLYNQGWNVTTYPSFYSNK